MAQARATTLHLNVTLGWEMTPDTHITVTSETILCSKASTEKARFSLLSAVPNLWWEAAARSLPLGIARVSRMFSNGLVKRCMEWTNQDPAM